MSAKVDWNVLMNKDRKPAVVKQELASNKFMSMCRVLASMYYNVCGRKKEVTLTLVRKALLLPLESFLVTFKGVRATFEALPQFLRIVGYIFMVGVTIMIYTVFMEMVRRSLYEGLISEQKIIDTGRMVLSTVPWAMELMSKAVEWIITTFLGFVTIWTKAGHGLIAVIDSCVCLTDVFRRLFTELDIWRHAYEYASDYVTGSIEGANASFTEVYSRAPFADIVDQAEYLGMNVVQNLTAVIDLSVSNYVAAQKQRTGIFFG